MMYDFFFDGEVEAEVEKVVNGKRERERMNWKKRGGGEKRKRRRKKGFGLKFGARCLMFDVVFLGSEVKWKITWKEREKQTLRDDETKKKMKYVVIEWMIMIIKSVYIYHI